MYFWIARWIFLLWAAMLVAWVVSLMTLKQAGRQQNSEAHFLQIGVQVVGLWMIFGSPFLLRRTLFEDRLLPARPDVAIVGLALTLAGMLVAGWAVILTGRARRDEAPPRRGLIFLRKGPYRLARHPIYSGLIFAALGTAIVFLRVECFVGALLIAAAFCLKIRMDERMMLRHFGEEYARYQNEVRALIPFVF